MFLFLSIKVKDFLSKNRFGQTNFLVSSKNVKVNKYFDFPNVIYTTNKNELKNNVVKQKHLSIGFFAPSEMESYSVTSTNSIPCLGGKRIMDRTRLHSSVT